jgi:hypothetical protein
VLCPSCNQRKARRACPALSQTICTVCCGTKRLVEIRCPADCAYLNAAREHPAAVVRKQQERDVAMLLPSIRHLTERQHQLFFLFHSVIARHTPEGFGRVNDEDVAEAASAMAATLETAARGVIYEHAPQSPIAQGLARAMKTMIDEIRAQGTKVYDAEAAIALRAIEQGARETASTKESTEAAGYLALVGRLLRVDQGPDSAARPETEGARAGSIILP